MKIGSYLPPVVMISVAMMFAGLRCWVDAAWIQVSADHPQFAGNLIWKRRSRPVSKAILVVAVTHAAGLLLFYFIRTELYLVHPKASGFLSDNGRQ
jgi:GPI-anchor transamidase subunit GAA1